MKCNKCQYSDRLISFFYEGDSGEELFCDLSIDLSYKTLDIAVGEVEKTIEDASIEIKFCPFCGREL